MDGQEPHQEDNPQKLSGTSTKENVGLPQDQDETAETFGSRIGEMMQHSFVTLAICMGERLGIFKYLSSVTEYQTSQQIATALKYKERYVREWLGSMVCAHIIEVTTEGEERFLLPPHRHAALVGPYGQNKTYFMWALPILAHAFTAISDCFKLDGPQGTVYSQYPEFHDWRDTCMRQKGAPFLRNLLEKAPGLIKKLEEGIDVLEIGSSSGIFSFILARMFPNSQIMGSDICDKEMEAAEQQARTEGISNLHFQVQDCTALPADWTEKWNLVFAIDVYHDMPCTDLGFSETFRVLRKGGMLLFNDVAAHTGIRANKDTSSLAFLYSVSLMHCMPLSLAGEGGLGLGNCWGQEMALSMLREAGFKNPQILDEKAIDYMAIKE